MILEGNDSMLFIKVGGEFRPIGCLTNNSFSENMQELPTTTLQNEGWATFRGGIQSYAIDFSGLKAFTMLSNAFISYDRLQLIKRQRTLIEWKEIRGNGLEQKGKGMIVELSDENEVNEEAPFSGTIKGFGKITMTLNETVLQNGEGNLVEDGNNNLIKT